MARAVIYVRVSFRRQVDGTSLEMQERVCREWCKAQGYEVAAVFCDAGESAKTTDRPEFQRMLAYLKRNKGRITHLVTHKFDRFSRDVASGMAVRLQLTELGVKLHSATEKTDESPSGRFLSLILSGAAQLDNETRAERATGGMRARAESGRWQWKAPPGYIANGRRGRGVSLNLDPERAPLLRQGFELMASGAYRLHEVLARLTALGLTTRKGASLSLWTFAKLLNNPVYMGRLVVPSWGMDVNGDWTPIVSAELFARVQRVMSGKGEVTAPQPRMTERFPLRRFILCTICNEPVTASTSRSETGKQHSYYHCHRGRKHLRVPAEKAESEFLALLESLSPKAGQAALVETLFRKMWAGTDSEGAAELEAMQKQLAELERQKANLLVAVRQGAVSAADIAGEMREINGSMTATREQMLLARSTGLDADTAADYLTSLLWNAAMLWEQSDLDGKQRLQRAIFPHGLQYRAEGGFGTPLTSFFSMLLRGSDEQEERMVRPERFELPAY